MSTRERRERREVVVEEPVVEKTKPVYRPPRIGESYQAVVPSLESSRLNTKAPERRRGKKNGPSQAAAALADEIAADLRSHQYHAKDRLIWSPNAIKANEVDEFLIFTRGLLEQTTHEQEPSTGGGSGRGGSASASSDASVASTAPAGPWRQQANGELIPIEADEEALSYLYAQRQNHLTMAKIRIVSELGMKREHKFLHALDTMYQQGATAATLEKRDRTTYVGAYSSGHVPQREGLLQKASTNPYPYQYPKFKPLPPPATDPTTTTNGTTTMDGITTGGAPSSSASAASSAASGGGGGAAAAAAAGGASSSTEEEDTDKDDGNNNSSAAVAMDVVATTTTGGTKKRATADKAEMRRMWTTLQERAMSLAKCVEMSRKSVKRDDRPKLTTVLGVIKEAAELPKLELPPGDTMYKDLEDAITSLKNSLATIRPQLALVHDAFNTIAPSVDDEYENGHCGSTIEELKEVLKSLRAQTVEIPEESVLIKVIKSAEQWQSMADGVIADMHKTSFLKARELLKQAESIPFHSEQKALLQDKMDEIESLSEEIQDLMQAPASVVLATGRLAAKQAASEPKPHKIQTLRELHNRVKAVGFKFPEGQALTDLLNKAEKWIAEADAALAASPDLKKLQALLEESANLPVDVSSTCELMQVKVEQATKWVEKVRKALPRKKTRGNTGEVTKVDYTAARTLLDEGSGIGVEVKEMDDIAGVLETAETWLQRVREALEESTDEASLDALQTLLSEADNIPVIMDEHKILASEIEIRKWGMKVQPRLDVEGKIPVSELEAILEEAGELRARLPLTAKEQRTWSKLPQESQAKSLLDAATQWLGRYRKCLNPAGSGLRRNVGLEKLLPLIEDGKKMKVDLGEYVEPLTEAVAAAERWYKESLPLLKACRVRMSSRVSSSASPAADDEELWEMEESGDEGGEEGGKRKKEAAGEGEEGAAQQQEPKKVALADVMACVASAENATLNIDLPEVEQLRTLIHRVGKWVENLQVTCPTRLSKRKGGRAKATAEEIRKLVEQGSKFPIDVTEEVAAIRDRLEETTMWQSKVDSELLSHAKDAMEELGRFDAFIKKKEEDRSKRSHESSISIKRKREAEAAVSSEEEPRPEGEQPEEDNNEDGGEEEMEPDEARLKRLEELVDEAGDVAIETKEEEMVGRHYRAHKWFVSCMEMLQYVDPKGLIQDATIRDMDKLVEEGKDLLGLNVDDEEDTDNPNHDENDDDEASGGGGSSYHRGGGGSSVGGDDMVMGDEYEEAMSKGMAGGSGHYHHSVPVRRKKTAEEVVREMGKSKDRRRMKLLEMEKQREQEEMLLKGNGTGDNSDDDEDESLAMDIDSANGRSSGSHKKSQGKNRRGGEEGEGEEDAGSSAAAAVVEEEEKRESDKMLDEVTQLWWDRIGVLRDIVEKSLSWLDRAIKAAGTGAEKVAIETLEGLVTEARGWEFEVEYGRKLEAELHRAQNIQSRAVAALHKKPLPLPALKTLIGEGDKCRVLLDEIKVLKKHLISGQRWVIRFQRSKEEDLEEMLSLSRDADEIKVDLSQELRSVRRITDRCCLCRANKEGGPLMTCAECNEQYHQRCLDINEPGSAEAWRRRGWRCARCLVRWHLKDSLEKATSTLQRYLAVPMPNPAGPGGSGDSLLAHESLAFALSTDGADGGHARPGQMTGFPPHNNRNLRVTAWMKRLLLAFKVCAENGPQELLVLGHPKRVKSSILVEVIRMAKLDPEVDSSLDVRELIWNLSVLFWGARLMCQLRKRPNLADLQALAKEMPSVGIINEPLQHMLNGLIARAMDWIFKAKPVYREAWIRQDLGVDFDRIRALLREKKSIPVRLNLERRMEAMLGEEAPGKRYCRCRGFYDGLFMVQCVACAEWFHGKCLQLRNEDLDKKTEYVCEDCCIRSGKPYRYPPFLQISPESALIEREDDEDTAEEEELLADRKCLEGIWPSLERIYQLEKSSAHVDPGLFQPMTAFPIKRRKQPTAPHRYHHHMMGPPGGDGPTLPADASMRMVGGGGGAGGTGAMMGGGGGAAPHAVASLPPAKKPKPARASSSDLEGSSSAAIGFLAPQRTSSRPPKPQQQLACFDYDLDLPPAQKIPMQPKKKPAPPPPAPVVATTTTGCSLDDVNSNASGDSEAQMMAGGGDDSMSEEDGSSSSAGLLGKRSRKPPKVNDDFVFEGRAAQRPGAPLPPPVQKENQPKRSTSGGGSGSKAKGQAGGGGRTAGQADGSSNFDDLSLDDDMIV